MGKTKLDLRAQKVRQVMAVHVVAVNPRDPVSEALKLFKLDETRAELAAEPEQMRQVRDLIQQAGLAA